MPDSLARLLSQNVILFDFSKDGRSITTNFSPSGQTSFTPKEKPRIAKYGHKVCTRRAQSHYDALAHRLLVIAVLYFRQRNNVIACVCVWVCG